MSQASSPRSAQPEVDLVAELATARPTAVVLEQVVAWQQQLDRPADFEDDDDEDTTTATTPGPRPPSSHAPRAPPDLIDAFQQLHDNVRHLQAIQSAQDRRISLLEESVRRSLRSIDNMSNFLMRTVVNRHVEATTQTLPKAPPPPPPAAEAPGPTARPPTLGSEQWRWPP